MTTLTQYDGSMNDTSNFGTDSTAGQGFKIPDNASVTGISIRGSKGASSSGTTFDVEIRLSTSTGTLIKTETFNTSILPSYTASPTFVDITFVTPVNLTATTQYVLVLKANNGHATDELRWSVDTTTPTYTDGYLWYGTTYAEGQDRNFKVYGNVQEIYSFTADAILQKTSSGSLAADAYLSPPIYTLTADAILQKTLTGSVIANAILKKTTEDSLVVDGVLQKTTSDTLDSDAVLFKTTSEILLADGVLFKTTEDSFDADAYLTYGVFADAVMFKTQLASLTADAIIFPKQYIFTQVGPIFIPIYPIE